MRKRNYPNGYLPKINYWQGKYDEAKSNNDYTQMEYALDKLIYFVQRQRLVYA